MIVYFADRHMNILGNASTMLPEGLLIVDDEKTEEIEAGVSVLELHIAYDALTREEVERCAVVGNYLLYQSGDEKSFYTIIETEADTKSREVMVYAEDAGLDLLNEIALPYTADKAYEIEHYVNKFAEDSGFEIGLNEVSGTKKLAWNDEQTVTERILGVAGEFDAEIAFSFDVEGMAVKHKYIDVYQKRGQDAGVQLHLDRDIDRMVTKKSIANLATALLPYGSTPEDSDIAINLRDYKYDDGDFYIDGNLLKSRTAWQQWSRFFADGQGEGDIVKTFNFDTVSQELLCEKAIEELKKIREPEVNYEIDVLELPKGTKIGDTVNIVDESGEVYFSARILKTEISETGRSVSVTIGDYLIKDNGISQQVQDLAANFAKQSQSAARALSIAQAAKSSATAAQATADDADAKAKAAAADLATAKQNLADVTSRVDATEEEVAAAQADVIKAQAAADKAKENAATAQNTADTAKANAKAAQTAADNAKSAADTAQAQADAAAKVATNYIQGTDDGLIVGNMEADTLGANVKVGSDAMEVRNGNTVLARYAEKKVELGKNSADSVIELCGSTGKISAIDRSADGDPQAPTEFLKYLTFESTYMRHQGYAIEMDASTAFANIPETEDQAAFATFFARSGVDADKNHTALLELDATCNKDGIGSSITAYTDEELGGRMTLGVYGCDINKHTLITIFSPSENYTPSEFLNRYTGIEIETPDIIKCVHSSTGNAIGVGVGNGGVNRGLHDEVAGKWQLYSDDTDLYLGPPTRDTFKPYYTKGDKIPCDISTGGYVTGGGNQVIFSVPLSKPLVGVSTVKATTNNGFRGRQGGKYTHGSSASAFVKPASYSCYVRESWIEVRMTLSSTANVANNDAIGIAWSGYLTFS